MPISQAINLARLVLEFEAETAQQERNLIWCKEARAAAQALERLKAVDLRAVIQNESELVAPG